MDFQAFRPISDTQGNALRHAVPRGHAHCLLRVDESLGHVAVGFVVPITGSRLHRVGNDDFLHDG